MEVHGVYVDRELWAIILADPDVGLDPAYRCMARRVCRQWRDLIDRAAPTGRGWQRFTLHRLGRKRIWCIDTALPWARGRIVEASALAECYHLRPVARAKDAEQTGALMTSDYERAFAEMVTCVPATDQCEVMMLSLDPDIVDHGLRIVEERATPAECVNAASSLVASAARSGQPWMVDRVFGTMSARARTSVCMWALKGISAEVFDCLLRHMPEFRVFETVDMEDSVARHAVDVFSGRIDRAWSKLWPREDADDIECALLSLIEHDNVALLAALDAAGLYDLPDDLAVETVYSRRSTKTARWLMERARQRSADALSQLTAALLYGALKRSYDDDWFPCSSHPEALLSWLLGGPTAYDPLASGAAPMTLARIFELASTPDDTCDVSRCLLWLCLRWPTEATNRIDAIRDAARQMLTRDGRWVDSYLCRDGSALEYLVYALDTIHVKMLDAGHRQSADTLLHSVDLYAIVVECTRDQTTKKNFIEHGRARCTDDDSVPVRLALIKTRVLHAIDPLGVDPWRAVFASAAAWRRWFRAPLLE
ncbi:F-box incomplete domain containing protein [Pandoravirus neocaledonia]|uniref:F-box incomplete domain containing protein n=1 Tax=Pandoravirus neocaledonia TaxID=2107708 RepID=A0A2U7UBC0_9VIRU|nr:F-box incomplete domain containing protein [Pandoravirus neocaledonia]AVK75758.1 F-box incomplete domain containing protein [Pandoravirus neocaledonia]